ncbi:hypothetical protein MMC30_008521 [Trapelia coarctata]|nr:hypothetical protein [Trapelia coarctata]
MSYIPLYPINKYLQLTLVNEVVYGPFIFFIKLTLFLLLLEIFGRLRWLKWLVWIGICVTALFYLATMVVYIVLCAPHGGQSQLDFLAAISSPQCESQSLSVVTGGFNIVSDLYILLTPFPAVWSLQMPRRRKIGISAIFLTGIAACISSILGLVYRLQLSRSTDNTWTVIPLWAVTITEVTSGFLVSCMPSAAAVYRHAMPGMSSLLSNYYQRFRGYGISDTAFELRESNNTSDTQSHYGHKHRMNMSPAARMLGQPHWDASRTNFSERVLDNASSTRVKDTGIRKVTEIQVVQRPQTTSHTTPNKIEVWEGQV